ncbi:MAG: HlyU family transcriptional regulator [Kiloniellaceae bacterium]
MGLFSKFFGGGGGDKAGGAKEGEAVEYKGFHIHPAAQPQGGQWLTAGIIRKEIDGAVKEHRFVRADTHASPESANDFAVVKGRQIIDEQGEGMFRD